MSDQTWPLNSPWPQRSPTLRLHLQARGHPAAVKVKVKTGACSFTDVCCWCPRSHHWSSVSSSSSDSFDPFISLRHDEHKHQAVTWSSYWADIRSNGRLSLVCLELLAPQLYPAHLWIPDRRNINTKKPSDIKKDQSHREIWFFWFEMRNWWLRLSWRRSVLAGALCWRPSASAQHGRTCERRNVQYFPDHMTQHLWSCKTSKSRLARLAVALCWPPRPEVSAALSLLRVRLWVDVNLRPRSKGLAPEKSDIVPENGSCRTCMVSVSSLA